MAPRVDPVASDEALPARTGVVIIGGGIIGTCTALFLAQKGVPVVLCEKGHIAGEQSSRNWGWCRKMGRDAREIPLAIESLRLWRGMNERIGRETGFRRCGIVYLCETRGGPGAARGLAGGGAAVPARHAAADAGRGGGKTAGADRGVGGRAVHRERRPRRAADGGAGDRRGGAPAGGHRPHRNARCAASRRRAGASPAW